MSKKAKRLERIKNNPRAVRPDELWGLLEDNGWTWRKAGGTSHRVYTKPGAPTFTIPHKVPYIKEHYVSVVLEALEEEK